MDRIKKSISKAEAMEELVADAFPEVITSRKNIEAFIAQNQSAARKLLKSIKRILEKMRNTFKGSKEHEMIKASLQTYEEAVSLLEGALKHVARMNDIELETGEGAVASSLKDDVKYSLKGYTEEEIERVTRPQNTKIANSDNDIKDFIDFAFKEESKDEASYLMLGKLEEKTVSTLNALFEADYEDYSFGLNSHDLRHINKQHGNEAAEQKRGQVPMNTENLFEAIKTIVDYVAVSATLCL